MSSMVINDFCLTFHLRRGGSEPSVPLIRPDEDSKADVSEPKIRCPQCKWEPDRSSEWTCWDCDHPEYYFNGCGTNWNTFNTGGVCPTCAHQWVWTSCLSCWGWSRHADWYAPEV